MALPGRNTIDACVCSELASYLEGGEWQSMMKQRQLPGERAV